MQAAIFWSSWPRAYQRLFYTGLVGVIAGLIGWSYFAYQGVDSVLHWDVLSELGEMPFGLGQFQANGSSFQIQATAYALTEQFVASPMAVIHPLTDWFCLILALIGVAITLMATSALPRLWYFGAMTAFILLTSSLQIDTILGRTDRLATIVLVTVFVGTSFYFQAFKRNTGLLTRLTVFTVLILVSVALLCTLGKATPADLLAYGYPAGMVLVILVAFWVSFEIMIGLTWLATNQTGRNSLPSFAALSVFYLGNLLLTELHTTRRIDWDLLYLNPFFVFVLSLGLGLWGQKKRESQQAGYWPFQPQGAFLYLGLASITLAFLAYVNGTANDSAIESLSQGINYAHLTGGILFFFYVLLNFGPQMREGKPVHIVLFKPAYIARFHVRGLSVILCVILMYYSNYYVFQQGVAGYYNAQGDLATSRQDYRLAETFYRQGATFDFQNHKSNYGLASLAWVQGDFASAAGFFRQALVKNPSAYAYAGLTRSLMNEELAFDAFFTAREGQKRFPENGELMTNLAYLHAKANGLDSAQYYYGKALTLTRQSGVPATNLMALYLRKGDTPAAEKLANEQSSDYVSVQVNRKAVELLNGKSSETKLSIGADSVLTLAQFALISNATLSDLKTAKTPPLSDKDLRILSQKEGNASYFDDLQYLNALVSYYDGNKLEGLELLSARAMADTAASGDRWRKPLAAFLNREIANEQAPPTSWTGDGSEELMRNPLNIKVLERYTAESNQKKEPQKAYNALYNALTFRQDSPEILKLYILQSLEMSLTNYAEDKLRILQSDFPEAYERFLPVYQQKRALIEKRQQDFQ